MSSWHRSHNLTQFRCRFLGWVLWTGEWKTFTSWSSREKGNKKKESKHENYKSRIKVFAISRVRMISLLFLHTHSNSNWAQQGRFYENFWEKTYSIPCILLSFWKFHCGYIFVLCCASFSVIETILCSMQTIWKLRRTHAWEEPNGGIKLSADISHLR